MIACFIGGFAGIQIISRWMHHFVPHSVVECEHQHEDDKGLQDREGTHAHDHRGHDHYRLPEGDDSHKHGHRHTQMAQRQSSLTNTHLTHLPRPQNSQRATSHRSFLGAESNASDEVTSDGATAPSRASSRPRTLQSRITESITQLATGKDADCHDGGPCYGYSDACPPACFKTIGARASKASLRSPLNPASGSNRPAATKSVTATESTPLLHAVSHSELFRANTRAAAEGGADSSEPLDSGPSDTKSATIFAGDYDNHPHTHSHSHDPENQHEEHHHHHVPENAFLSIGLQTSIAIALHKLPEGFITYATNHANPKLGVSVFLALFIHNITEGFALALPLYLAINNRIKAMLLSFVLGGLSQPLGAGIAAIWFAAAGKGRYQPDESVYGAMFAVTAGIMASVALQLFQESLSLAHSKGLCLVGAFAGMTILGISSALTA